MRDRGCFDGLILVAVSLVFFLWVKDRNALGRETLPKTIRRRRDWRAVAFIVVVSVWVWVIAFWGW